MEKSVLTTPSPHTVERAEKALKADRVAAHGPNGAAAAADGLDPRDGKWPLDQHDFLRAIEEKAAMLERGHKAGYEAAPATLKAAGILFAGMGFSGVSSNLVQDACTRSLDMPFSIVKHYQFPRHVKPDWQCFAVTYSGETEETLQVAQQAAKRGVEVTSFATGGAITKIADRNVLQPPGYQPRAALGFAWFSILGFLEGSGLLDDSVPVKKAAQAVKGVDEQCGPSVPEAKNPAKQLARRLADKVPQIYATPAFFGVAHQFRGMLNENAKKIAHIDLIPECNHNDLTGWGDDPLREHFTALCLSHANQNPQIRKRIAYMEQRYTSWGVPWHHHQTGPIDTMAQHIVEQARAIQFLDYTSFYCAMLRGEDPSDIREIKGLKAFLKET